MEEKLTKGTQRMRVMCHLKTGKTLTSLEALREYGIPSAGGKAGMSEGMKLAENLREIWNDSGDVFGEMLDLAMAFEMFELLTADDYNQVNLIADQFGEIANRLREAANAA